MFDAVVIGGGLAGCSAAITLTRRGHRVLLLEAGTYPQPKVCGEFLSPEVVALFDQAGFLPHLRRLNPVTIRTVRITAPDEREWCGTFPTPGLGVSRFALDHALVHYATALGVTVVTGTRVTKIDGDLERGFTLTAQTAGETRQFHGRGAVAAYGKRSNLDRVLNRPFFRDRAPYIGLKQHFMGAPLPEHLDLHVFRGGYCGISHVEAGRTNVCLLVEGAVFQAAGSNIERFVEWMCGENRALGRWLRDATPLYPDWLSIGQVTLSAKTLTEGDLLLTGDAAGMIAPLAGDGMAMAVHGGTLAAAALHRYLTGEQDAAAMKQSYTRTWQRTFRNRLRLGRALQSALVRPRVLSHGLRLMNGFPAAGDWLIHHTRDLRLLEKTT